MENFLSKRERIDKTVKNSANEGKNLHSSSFGSVDNVSLEQVDIDSGDNAESPKVELISNGKIVQRIRVTCTCGKCLELRCEY